MNKKNLTWKAGILSVLVLAASAVSASAAACCAAASPAENPANAANPAVDNDNGLVAHYEGISAALVADDLEKARETASATAEAAKAEDLERAAEFAAAVAEANDLASMREAFVPLSREVIKRAAGKEGLYVMNCPMVENGKWLQSSEEVRNPYMGQRMIACGGVEMETTDIELRACCEERRACCDDIGACCPV